jgi:hypothetical protein
LVVDVIMNMVAAGLMPAPRLEKLNLVGLGVMPPDISSWFMAMPAPLPTPLPLRLSRASLEGAALEHVLEEPLPTWRAIPSPRWVPSLPGIDLDKGRNFGTVALIELLVLSQSALTQHKHRQQPQEFMSVLWVHAVKAFATSSLASPLASHEFRLGLRAKNLSDLFDHVDRSSHLGPTNSNAFRARKSILGDIMVFKQNYVKNCRGRSSSSSTVTAPSCSGSLWRSLARPAETNMLGQKILETKAIVAFWSNCIQSKNLTSG